MPQTSFAARIRVAALGFVVLPALAACNGLSGIPTVERGAFTSKEYGVKASPRVTHSANPRKGGGRYLVGQPYKVKGEWYTPKEDPNYVATGTASWYGKDFHGRLTANGEIFAANAITGSHPTLPLPSYVRVTNTNNGRSMVVRVNDRGPYVHGRVMDLSYRAASLLGYSNIGVTNVKVEYLGKAPLQGDDTKMLLASLQQQDQFGNATRLAVKEEGPTSLADMVGGLFGLGYVDGKPVDAQGENQMILSAHDAVNAMATHSEALDQWAASIDEDARAVKIELGTFKDDNQALAVAEQFAILGAVDQQPAAVGTVAAIRLTLTHLKPGVVKSDVAEMARNLGLKVAVQ